MQSLEGDVSLGLLRTLLKQARRGQKHQHVLVTLRFASDSV